MAIDWTSYYKAVLANPSATPEAKEEARRALGLSPLPTPTITTTGEFPSVYLQPGSRGPEVKQLQDFLVSRGYMTPEEVATGPGIYGPRTKAAVEKLQRDLGVDAGQYYGYFGPKTIAALKSKIDQEIVNAQNRLSQAIQSVDLLSQTREPKIINIPDRLSENLNAWLSSQNLSDKNATYLATIKPLIDLLQADLEARRKAEEERKGWMEKMAELLGKRTKTQELLTAREEADIEKLIAERKILFEEAMALQKQITDLQAERDKALLISEGRKAPLAFIRGEQAEINRRYESRIANLNAQLGYKMAMYQAKTGEINEARTWINDIVNAATYDQEYDFRVLSTMLNLHNAEYTELGRDIRATIGQIVDLQQQMLALNRTELREKANMMIQVAQQGITPLSWDQLNQMTYEQVANWAAQQIVAKAPEERKEEIERYAQDVFWKRISLSSVPDRIQAQVSKRVRELEATERTLTDEEWRAKIRTIINTLRRQYPGLSDDDLRQEIADAIITDPNLTPKDKERGRLILNEILPPTIPSPEKKPGFWERTKRFFRVGSPTLYISGREKTTTVPTLPESDPLRIR